MASAWPEQGDKFERALAVVKRSDQRLDDADRAVVGAGVAPGFELVRCVDMPLAEFGGFVLIEAVMDAQGNLAVLKRVGEVEIGGRVVDRVAAENDEQVNFAGTHVGDEVFERFGLVDWISVDRVGVENRLADVASLVMAMRERMNSWWLMITHNDRRLRLRWFMSSWAIGLRCEPSGQSAGKPNLAHNLEDFARAASASR